jgi:hypothetical protein
MPVRARPVEPGSERGERRSDTGRTIFMREVMRDAARGAAADLTFACSLPPNWQRDRRGYEIFSPRSWNAPVRRAI